MRLPELINGRLDQTINVNQPFVAMITQGSAQANGIAVTAGDLIEGEQMQLESDENFGLVLIRESLQASA